MIKYMGLILGLMTVPAVAQQTLLNNQVMIVKKSTGAAPVKDLDDMLVSGKGNGICKFVGYWSDGTLQCHAYTTSSINGMDTNTLVRPNPDKGWVPPLSYTTGATPINGVGTFVASYGWSHLFNYKDTLYGLALKTTATVTQDSVTKIKTTTVDQREYVGSTIINIKNKTIAPLAHPLYNSNPDNCNVSSGCAGNYPMAASTNQELDGGRTADIVFMPGVGVIMPYVYHQTTICGLDVQKSYPVFSNAQSITPPTLAYTNYSTNCGGPLYPVLTTHSMPNRFFSDLAKQKIYFYGLFQGKSLTGNPKFEEYDLATKTHTRSYMSDFPEDPTMFGYYVCSWPSGLGKNGKFYFTYCGSTQLAGLYTLDLNVFPAKTTKIASLPKNPPPVYKKPGYSIGRPFYYMGVVEKEGKDYLMITGFPKLWPLDQ